MGYYDSYYGYYESTDPVPFVVLSIIAAIVCAILLFVMVLPDKKRANLSPFFQKVADIFNFKNLLLESVLKFIYTALTLFSILFGFFMLFMKEFGQSLFLPGLLVMILGPVLLRISFEFTMMIILLVKNVIDINKKLGYSPKTAEEAPKTTTPVTPKEEPAPVCSACGKAPSKPGLPFCEFCGNKMN